MSEVFDRLVDEFSRLPGIGRKTARRLALHVLKAEPSEAADLAHALTELKSRTRPCKTCHNIAEPETPEMPETNVICEICADPARDRSRILVVEEVSDLMAVEAARGYNGLYHVLLGAISPIDGIGPDDTTVASLVGRVSEGSVQEVIIATNPNLKGEATSLYIIRELKPTGVKLTRIAYGMPMGGSLEYADPGTLAKSLEGRREVGR